MRAPLSWLRELVAIPSSETADQVAEHFVRAGLEVEAIHRPGHDVSGPLVLGRVLGFVDETHSNGRTIRWCQVEVGESGAAGASPPRGIVCGAANFAAGDLVVVALPGTVLPGGVAITALEAYGHRSEGMICSARELGLGEDHAGILNVPDDLGPPGADAAAALLLRDEVIELAVTPDRGYCFSMRGLARELAIAYQVTFTDPAAASVPAPGSGPGQPGGAGAAHPVRIEDPSGADRIVLRTLTGLDAAAPSPAWLRRRLQLAGMRPISLPVDVTNYVMLELGQPLHAFDRARLAGAVVVRRARTGEVLHTLDGTERRLDPDDLLITDSSGPIALAGTMGGSATEIDESSTEIVLEAAHFTPEVCARQARRHKIPSEAVRRFERGVDPDLPPVASARAAALLGDLGGAKEIGCLEVDLRRNRPTISLDPDLPSRVVGRHYSRATVLRRLDDVGCVVEESAGEAVAAPFVADSAPFVADSAPVAEDAAPVSAARSSSAATETWTVRPPSWRGDLVDPYDLVEEVARLEGYDQIPSVLPVAPAGSGYTRAQRLRRRAGQAMASFGFVESPSYPFVGPAAMEALGLPALDPRGRLVRLANPLSDAEPFLRSTLLPGLIATLRRNVGRGTSDVAVFEIGSVFRPKPQMLVAPRLRVDARPQDDELAALDAALPDQPQLLGLVLVGESDRSGWWGSGRPATWADAVETVRALATALNAQISVRQATQAPWHPGRCAEVFTESAGLAVAVGHAGELHPRVCQALGVPARTCAAEVDLDVLIAAAVDVVPGPAVSTFPVATVDVALVVPSAVPAATVERALRDGAGDLLESARLFDVFVGEQVGPGLRSLAFTLRMRAPDRTLTSIEINRVRDAAVACAGARTGAALRGADALL